MQAATLKQYATEQYNIIFKEDNTEGNASHGGLITLTTDDMDNRRVIVHEIAHELLHHTGEGAELSEQRCEDEAQGVEFAVEYIITHGYRKPYPTINKRELRCREVIEEILTALNVPLTPSKYTLPPMEHSC